ncbi:MAG: outer membrane protein assembly factor BamD [Myxococcaceae bacterium]
MHTTLKPVVLLSLLLLAGCKTFGDATNSAEPDYAKDAETNLKLGREALDGRNYVEAERYFEHVKSKFPFLEASKEAELLLADTDFDRDRFTEARDRYQNFVKLHPTHGRVDYAAYRAAFTHYKEIPSDLFVLPSSREKDQVEVRNTLKAMQDFQRTYPKSQYMPEAEKYAKETRKRLADHEMYVAGFYAKRNRWPAVVGRLNYVIRNYPGVGYDEEALFGLHDAYLKLKDKPHAEETLRTIIATMPNTPAAKRAQKLLGT